MGWGCRGSWWGLLRADSKEKREQGPGQGRGRCKGLDVQGQSGQSPGGAGSEVTWGLRAVQGETIGARQRGEADSADRREGAGVGRCQLCGRVGFSEERQATNREGDEGVHSAGLEPEGRWDPQREEKTQSCGGSRGAGGRPGGQASPEKEVGARVGEAQRRVLGGKRGAASHRRLAQP